MEFTEWKAFILRYAPWFSRFTDDEFLSFYELYPRPAYALQIMNQMSRAVLGCRD